MLICFKGPERAVSANTAQLYDRQAKPFPYLTIIFPVIKPVPNYMYAALAMPCPLSKFWVRQ